MTLGETAGVLLAAFAEQLEAQGIQVPDRRYVAPGGQIAEDGDQLVLVLATISQGQPGRPDAGTFVPGSEILAARFTVQLIHAIPALHDAPTAGMMIPGEEELGESGVRLLDEAEALVNAAMAIHAEQLVTQGGLQGFSIGPCVPLGPDGGMAGTQLPVEISLSGGING
jgi:hypothetical protein